MEGYHYEATSVVGFVQQLVAGYVRHGYVFFVPGRVPPGKEAAAIDRKLLSKYGIAMNSSERHRRKQRGLANLQYIRYRDEFLMLATRGRHRWFSEERRSIRDARKVPIHFHGYSIRVRVGGYLKKPPGAAEAQRDGRPRVRVLIARKRLLTLKGELLSAAVKLNQEELSARFYRLPFEPYAPIRKQLLNLLRQVNRKRRQAGLDRVPVESIRYRRRIVKPFEPVSDQTLDTAMAFAARRVDVAS